MKRSSNSSKGSGAVEKVKTRTISENVSESYQIDFQLSGNVTEEKSWANGAFLVYMYQHLVVVIFTGKVILSLLKK